MDGYILSQNELNEWIDRMADCFTVYGPIPHKDGQTVFRSIRTAKDLALEYRSTMTAPRVFIYPPRQPLLTVDRENDVLMPAEAGGEPQIVFGMHPCDMHAVAVLDRVFLGGARDPLYAARREATSIIVLNCTAACDQGFCPSMGTGPFLNLSAGCDVEISPLGERCLVEFGSRRGADLLDGGRYPKARPADLRKKQEIEKKARSTFAKRIDTRGLPELLARNQHHPVFRETADARCLGCTNCTMVCPTCYCYDVEDTTSFDLKTTERTRRWDSCQELNFARVHENNFRASREARLRQFVTHKLSSWLEQYGCFGCIGCGRCMTWCPTGIDLTEIAESIRDDDRKGKAQ